MKREITREDITRLRAIGHDIVEEIAYNNFCIVPGDIRFLVDMATNGQNEVLELSNKATIILKMISIVSKRTRTEILSRLVHILKKSNRKDYDKGSKAPSLFYDIFYIDQTKHFQGGGNYSKSKFDANAQGQYPYIPSSLSDIIHLPKEFIKKEGRFIDVGCGIGDKVFLYYVMYDQEADGIEYDFYTYAIAQNQLLALRSIIPYQKRPVEPIRLFHEDAFNFDFQPYSKIYMYRPLSDDEKMSKLYQHVVDTIKPGALIFEVIFGQLKRDVKDNLVRGLKVHEEKGGENKHYFERI